MCGIAGFVGNGDQAVLDHMCVALAHRGPDGQGTWIDAEAGVHLGHRRLAVIDPAGGAQPMHDGDLVVVFNGEIYNFRELRAELERSGARFRSDHSDTEVLLHGYRAWGEKLPTRLNGMWAFAIYDRRARTLFCSRDRFGKKPFYFHHGPRLFVFASELDALRAYPDVPSDEDPAALQKYFAYGFIPAPRTLLKGVEKLPAGCSLKLDVATGRCVVRRYWRYEPAPDCSLLRRPVTELVDELEQRLRDAVKRRLVADVPLGVFLSGGLDSSLVAALASEEMGAQRLKTFSIGFDESSFDESPAADRVARYLGSDHHPRRLALDEVRRALPLLLLRIDDPIADSSMLPTWLLSSFAREQVTVALGGDGADELFAGYDPFKALRYARWLPRPFAAVLGSVAGRLPVSHAYMSFDFKLKRLVRGVRQPDALRLPVWMAPVDPSRFDELFSGPIHADELYSEAIEAWERSTSDDDVDRATCFFVDLYLQDNILVKIDRASMWQSLEVRSPFLDVDMVDFASRLPAALKLHGRRGKWLLRRLAERLLPADIVHRRKQGFALPVGRWLADGHLGDNVPVPPVRATFWQMHLAEHRAGREDHRLYLWADTVLSHAQAGRAEPRQVFQEAT